MRIDAHCHTDCSDGNITIEERIAFIKRLNLDAATITDHDFISTEQVSRARLAAGEMPYINGIELSLTHENKIVHMLGYFIDPENEKLQNHIGTVQSVDKKNTERLLDAGRRDGLTFHIDDLVSPSLHTFYSMRFIKKTAEMLFSNNRKKMLDYFFHLLSITGLTYPAFSNWPVRKGIDLIRQAGGIAVLAHPGGEQDKLMRALDFTIHNEDHIKRYVDWGLDGMEISSPCHTLEEMHVYSGLTKKYNLLSTSGSDCHGDDPFLGPAVMGTFNDLHDDLYERMTAFYKDRH